MKIEGIFHSITAKNEMFFCITLFLRLSHYGLAALNQNQLFLHKIVHH